MGKNNQSDGLAEITDEAFMQSGKRRGEKRFGHIQERFVGKRPLHC